MVFKITQGDARIVLITNETSGYNGYYAGLVVAEINDGGEYQLARNSRYSIIYKTADIIQYSHVETLEIPLVADTIEIEEPVGIDNFKVSLKRGDYHGISAEYSDTTLDFYGDAIPFIDQYYSQDIDAVIRFIILTNDNTTLYEGVLDLSTYSRKSGEYKLVSCKVGEIGIKSDFNARVSTDVAIDGTKTLQKKQIAHQPRWHNILIPIKHLLFTNITEQSEDEEKETVFLDINKYYLFSLNSSPVNEFGVINTSVGSTASSLTIGDSIFSEDEDFDSKFGNDTTFTVEGEFSIKYVGTAVYDGAPYNPRGTIRVGICNKAGVAVSSGIYQVNNPNFGGAVSVPISRQNNPLNTFNTADGVYLFVENRTNVQCRLTVTVKKGSRLQLSMYDTLAINETPVPMLPIHDAINTIVEAISDNALAVKSDFYAHKGSVVNPTSNAPGYGALKAITNGYKIRGLFQDEGNSSRFLYCSFKTLVESLNAIDCIGWGFSNENGQLCIRVERWDWFYNNIELLSISGIKTLTRKMSPDDVITTLSIGYKKYATHDDFTSIETVHGERTFQSPIKALQKEKKLLSELIADNYAIEETRRARNINPLEEFKYDENIFIFELTDSRASESASESFSIASTASQADGIDRADEFINAKLSPRHNAARWRDFLFTANKSADMNFNAGTINYNASYAVLPYYHQDQETGKYIWSLKPYCEDQEGYEQSEKDDISYVHAKFKAEEVEFEYPITAAQYAAIKANPYGLIVVNNEPCWIKKCEYTLVTGLARFTLIPKYIEED